MKKEGKVLTHMLLSAVCITLWVYLILFEKERMADGKAGWGDIVIGILAVLGWANIFYGVACRKYKWVKKWLDY